MADDKLFIVAIAGGSGSGKTTLAHEVHRWFGEDQCAILGQDHYYIDQSHRFDGDGGSVNFDHPESLDFALLEQHLAALRRGESVQVPRYEFASHRRLEETAPFAPLPTVIVEGTLILSQENLRPHFDVAVFLDVAEPLRFERRLRRDVHERGREEAGVRRQFLNQVKPMHDQFVQPSREFAQVVVDHRVSPEECLKRIIEKRVAAFSKK